jgi:hypothetical protein
MIKKEVQISVCLLKKTIHMGKLYETGGNSAVSGNI